MKALKWNRSAQLFTDFAAFYIGDPVEFDCSLTQPWVNVTLWFSQYDSYAQIIPDDRIRKINQKFMIDKIRMEDAGEYQCRAANITPSDVTYVHVSPGKCFTTVNEMYSTCLLCLLHILISCICIDIQIFAKRLRMRKFVAVIRVFMVVP